MKISKKVAGVEYAIRDIVSAAREIELQGKTVDYLNIGDPVQCGFQPPQNVKQAMIDAQKSLAEDDRKRDQMDQDLLVDAAKILGQYGTNVDVAQIKSDQAAPRYPQQSPVDAVTGGRF